MRLVSREMLDHGASQSEQCTSGFIFCHSTQTRFALATEFVSQVHRHWLSATLWRRCSTLLFHWPNFHASFQTNLGWIFFRHAVTLDTGQKFKLQNDTKRSLFVSFCTLHFWPVFESDLSMICTNHITVFGPRYCLLRVLDLQKSE